MIKVFSPVLPPEIFLKILYCIINQKHNIFCKITLQNTDDSFIFIF